ncbi:MAG: alpha/beta hydrolase [Pseudomonadota bacterium]
MAVRRKTLYSGRWKIVLFIGPEPKTRRLYFFMRTLKFYFTISLLFALSLYLTACVGIGFVQKISPVGNTYYKAISTQAGYLRLFVRDEGQGDPVLLIHGFGANIFSWRYLIPELSKTHRVIAVDLKGFGLSDKPYDEEYSVFDQADIIFQLMRDMRLKNVTLVGHSFGGGIALATYFKAKKEKSDIISKMAILDGLAYKQPIPFFLHVMRTPVVSDLGIALVPPEVHARASLSYSYHKDHRITEEAVQNYAQPYYNFNGRYAAKQTAKQILPENIDVYTKQYSRIKVPVKLIWCKHDRVVPLINGLKLNSALPNSHLEILDDCGHIPQEEAPSETLDILQKFLKRSGPF